MLGQVFDVTKGSKHYGVDGGYNFFSGKDATKAFITGDFTEEGLIENIDDFEPKQCAELNTWIEFYHENYKYIGRLNGHFYDSEGNPTEALDRFHECTKEGNQEKEAEEADRAKFPPCNSRWSRTEGKQSINMECFSSCLFNCSGGWVSCAPGSGGIKREWGGVPRQYFYKKMKDPRCACIRDSGLNADGQDTGNRGDLDNPLFKVYENCDPQAIECKISG